MPLVDMRELEERAAAMAVAELGAVEAQRRDNVPGVPPGTRDFDIVFADGHEEPLEVTSNLNDIVMTTIGRTEGGVISIDADVRHYWMVSGNQTWTGADGTEQPFDRRRVEGLLRPLIEQLERDGQESFEIPLLAWPTAYSETPRHREEALQLHKLGIAGGSSIEAKEPELGAGVSLHLGSGGAYGPETLTAVLEAIASLPDNIAKLASCSDAERRHLFVILSTRGSSDMAGWALEEFLGGWVWDQEPPPLALPAEITTIWAGTRERGIYMTPPGNWQRFGATTD